MTSQSTERDSWKQAAASEAAQLTTNGMFVGLGTGSTANYFIHALAQRFQEGIDIAGVVPSSIASSELAASLGLPLTNLDTNPDLDLYVDGADEIDPQLCLIKGAGGALLREKIVASAARSFIVIADVTKQVTQLGHLFPVPVETAPFAVTVVGKRLAALGATIAVRQKEGKPFITDNSNLIIDCTFPNGITDPVETDAHIHSIVGVVETGLFIHLAKLAFIGGPTGVQRIP